MKKFGKPLAKLLLDLSLSVWVKWNYRLFPWIWSYDVFFKFATNFNDTYVSLCRKSDEPHPLVTPDGYVDNLKQAIDLYLNNR